jgi:hypothetical protein
LADKFEQAVGIAAGSTDLQPSGSDDPIVIDREGVLGNPWLDDNSKMYIATWGHVKWPPTHDVWWWTDYVTDNGQHFTYVTGANFNWDWFNDKTKPWQVFITYPPQILNWLAGYGENDDYSPNSLTYASNMVKSLADLADSWATQFGDWADGVDSSDSDFQGSAAGVLHERLIQFKSQLKSIALQLRTPDIAGDLSGTADTMKQVANSLAAAYNAWWDDSQTSNLFTQVQFEFSWAINNGTIHLGTPTATPISSGDSGEVVYGGDNIVRIDTPHGDPMTPDFWKNVEDAAKRNWRNGLSSLDESGKNFISQLSASYDTTTAALPTVIVSPPAPSSPNPNGGGSNNPGGGGINNPGGGSIDPNKLLGGDNDKKSGSGGGIDGSGQGNTDFGNLFKNLDSGGGSGGGGSAHSGGIDGGGLGGSDLDLSKIGADASGGHFDGSGGSDTGADLAAALGAGNSLFNTGSGGSDEDTVTGPDGKVLTDAEGDPITAPPGSTISSDGTVVGPDGKPVLGADGKPLKVPTGSKITQDDSALGGDLDDDTVLGPGGKPLTGADGQPLRVPQGSTIRSDGTVIGPDGKPVLGTDGKPLTVPKGSTLEQTGAGGLYDRDVKNTGAGDLDEDEFLHTGGSGGSSGIGSLGSPGSGAETATAGGVRMTGSGFGMSDRAKSLIDPDGAIDTTGTPEGVSAAAREAEEMEQAAQEENMMGRVATVGGTGGETPMMPPMSGGMGGVGGGATGGRKTWVTEDEETWGTASGGPGVIGR